VVRRAPPSNPLFATFVKVIEWSSNGHLIKNCCITGINTGREAACWGKWPRLVFPWQLAPQGQA
jgi:hypothetical protein